jgi:hypothetical protein
MVPTRSQRHLLGGLPVSAALAPTVFEHGRGRSLMVSQGQHVPATHIGPPFADIPSRQNYLPLVTIPICAGGHVALKDLYD